MRYIIWTCSALCTAIGGFFLLLYAVAVKAGNLNMHPLFLVVFGAIAFFVGFMSVMFSVVLSREGIFEKAKELEREKDRYYEARMALQKYRDWYIKNFESALLKDQENK